MAESLRDSIRRLEPRLDDEEVGVVIDGSENEIVVRFGYSLARCPDDKCACLQDAAWGHPCSRDEAGEYECMRARSNA